MYAEFQQVLWEIGIRRAIYSTENYGPDEETFTAGMRNAVLQRTPTSLFVSLVAILVPHLGQPINEVTHTLADLGEPKAMREIGSATQE